ncbi:hypothetical protein F4778DRAFT_764954 [Xylariomycetidae sp. FL2044]|nr:hypothetical protein F4778DRAFT_764954 [Xylariomycetidae sp. FL2044]
MHALSSLALAFAAASSVLATPLAPAQNETEYKQCGGQPSAGFCDKLHICVTDPRIQVQIPEAPGICVPFNYEKCAGPNNLSCELGDGPFECFDWPNDDCFPQSGGEGCEGICLYPL